jgi:hypothetical protein
MLFLPSVYACFATIGRMRSSEVQSIFLRRNVDSKACRRFAITDNLLKCGQMSSSQTLATRKQMVREIMSPKGQGQAECMYQADSLTGWGRLGPMGITVGSKATFCVDARDQASTSRINAFVPVALQFPAQKVAVGDSWHLTQPVGVLSCCLVGESDCEFLGATVYFVGVSSQGGKLCIHLRLRELLYGNDATNYPKGNYQCTLDGDIYLDKADGDIQRETLYSVLWNLPVGGGMNAEAEYRLTMVRTSAD